MVTTMADLGISGIGDAELIASGGSALVYRARTTDGVDVAVKLLRGIQGAEISRRFEREQRAAERLSEHPNIIDVHRSGISAAGEPFLLMPLMARGSLADELERGAFALGRAVADVLIAADAIDFAHRRGVLHRDLKPGNLLRTDDEGVLVTDFGIARVLDAGISSATIGATTPLYAAPEVLTDNVAGVQSDVYALGAVLYALLHGRPAFADSPNIWATIARIRTEAPPWVEGVPAPIMRVVEQAMAKDPADRPPTAHQLRLNLLAALDAGETWRPPSPAEVTMPASPPGPAMVPVVVTDGAPLGRTIDGPFIPSLPRASTAVTPTAPPDRHRRKPPPAPPLRRGLGAKLAASAASLLLVTAFAWFGVNRALGSDVTPTDQDAAGPVDPTLPSPVAETTGETEENEALDDGRGNSEPATDDADATPTPAPEATPIDRLVSFDSAYFSAYFPEGWSVTRSDLDVGYGFRSEFVADGMYLNVDTTPSELRTGTATIAESARRIAASIGSASEVSSETVAGLELHSFTFRNDRGVPSIDIFFEVDGDGFAIVAGSTSKPDAAFDIARQVALSVRSAP